MRKTVIFHMYYNGEKTKGNRTARRTYHVLTSKNTIKNDFFDWIKKEHAEVVKEIGETPTIVDLKIIGL
jgi:hypothetical protein